MGAQGKITTVSLSDNEPLDLSNLSKESQLEHIRRLQKEMGQTGYEAGDPDATPRRKLYVNTSKAYNINYYLNTGSIDSPRSQWQNYGYTEQMVRNDIAKIDSGMKPLSESLTLYRYVDAGALGRILDDGMWSSSTESNIIKELKNDTAKMNEFRTLVEHTTYTQPAYSSLTYSKAHSTFDAYPIRFKVTMQAGTPAIVTNNFRENEILGGRGLNYKFTGGVRVKTEYSTALKRNQDYLEIDVTI